MSNNNGVTDAMVEVAARELVLAMIEDDPSTTRFEDASKHQRKGMLRLARRIITAALGETHVVVPREATEEMLSRGAFHCVQGAGGVRTADLLQAKSVYRAMIAAATAHNADEAPPSGSAG